jgi:hypothetical protein
VPYRFPHWTTQSYGEFVLKRIYHPTQDGPFLLNLNPKIIGWKYLSFQVARLTQDQTLQDDSKSEEVVAGDVRRFQLSMIQIMIGSARIGKAIRSRFLSNADAALRA